MTLTPLQAMVFLVWLMIAADQYFTFVHHSDRWRTKLWLALAASFWFVVLPVLVVALARRGLTEKEGK